MCKQDLEIIEKIKQTDSDNDIIEGIKIMRQKENYTKSEQEKQSFEMKTSVTCQLLDRPIP